MRNRFINKYLILAFISALLVSCELKEMPLDTANKESVFGSENGLKLYATSFYDWLPSANNIHQADAVSDYIARRDVPDFIREGNVYSPTTNDNTSASGYSLVALGEDWNWDWGALRNINHFLENNNNPKVSSSTRLHYDGIARFFRAWFYFEKVKRYGNVPWVNKALDVSDSQLYSGRDSRVLVIDSVLADLDFAIQNLNNVVDDSRTLVTKDVALALKSRVALFEGTFRKYHTEMELSSSSGRLLEAAAAAAQSIIENGRYRLNSENGDALSYRQLFISEQPVSSEIMLATTSSLSLGIRHAANWYFTSSTTGVRQSFIRPFIHTYLNIDGTPYTNDPSYKTNMFSVEMKDRDKRLQQTIRSTDYYRVNSSGEPVLSLPNFTYTYTGYQPIKWSVDNMSIDGGNNNTNSISLIRYAEVLLNYAEAKAELGKLTNDDWIKTIGALRARAGITGGLDQLPAQADSYLQSTYFPSITDAALLEVRRERGVELALEGFRFYDLIRWKRGELMEMDWTGIYVPEVNKAIDLDGDGSFDVYFYTQEPETKVNGIAYVDVSTASNKLTQGTSGELVWLPNIKRKWDAKKYLYPVPEEDLLTNPKLEQNPGW